MSHFPLEKYPSYGDTRTDSHLPIREFSAAENWSVLNYFQIWKWPITLVITFSLSYICYQCIILRLPLSLIVSDGILCQQQTDRY